MSRLPAKGPTDLEIVRALLVREPSEVAWTSFVECVQHDIYATCCNALPPSDVQSAYLEIFSQLKSNRVALLGKFDGRARLSSYLRLTARDLLAQRVLHLFVDDPASGWRAFEHFFKADIVRIVGQYFPSSGEGGGCDEDRYHDVLAFLIESDYRRIRAYDGKRSFGGFVREVVNNSCVDLLRAEVGRLRLPAAIGRLPELEQEVFRQLHWKDCPRDQLALALVGKFPQAADVAAIARAVEGVQAALPEAYRVGQAGAGRRPQMVPLPGPQGPDGPAELADERPTPEDHILDEEEDGAREGALAALREALATLPDDCRLYLQYTRLKGLPPREVARLMARPVEEIHRMKSRAEAMLTRALADHAAIKKWRQMVNPGMTEIHAARPSDQQ